MMYLINRELLKRDLIDNYSFYPVIVKNALEKQPVVDIVICGLCKYHRSVGDRSEMICLHPDGLERITPDSFCSYGERGEENA